MADPRIAQYVQGATQDPRTQTAVAAGRPPAEAAAPIVDQILQALGALDRGTQAAVMEALGSIFAPFQASPEEQTQMLHGAGLPAISMNDILSGVSTSPPPVALPPEPPSPSLAARQQSQAMQAMPPQGQQGPAMNVMGFASPTQDQAALFREALMAGENLQALPTPGAQLASLGREAELQGRIPQEMPSMPSMPQMLDPSGAQREQALQDRQAEALRQEAMMAPQTPQEFDAAGGSAAEQSPSPLPSSIDEFLAAIDAPSSEQITGEILPWMGEQFQQAIPDVLTKQYWDDRKLQQEAEATQSEQMRQQLNAAMAPFLTASMDQAPGAAQAGIGPSGMSATEMGAALGPSSRSMSMGQLPAFPAPAMEPMPEEVDLRAQREMFAKGAPKAPTQEEMSQTLLGSTLSGMGRGGLSQVRGGSVADILLGAGLGALAGRGEGINLQQSLQADFEKADSEFQQEAARFDLGAGQIERGSRDQIRQAKFRNEQRKVEAITNDLTRRQPTVLHATQDMMVTQEVDPKTGEVRVTYHDLTSPLDRAETMARIGMYERSARGASGGGGKKAEGETGTSLIGRIVKEVSEAGGASLFFKNTDGEVDEDRYTEFKNKVSALAGDVSFSGDKARDEFTMNAYSTALLDLLTSDPQYMAKFLLDDDVRARIMAISPTAFRLFSSPYTPASQEQETPIPSDAEQFVSSFGPNFGQ